MTSKGNDDSIGKRGWREALTQIKVWKTPEYWMYFKFSKRKRWAKDSAAAAGD